MPRRYELFALLVLPFLLDAPSVWGQTAADFDEGRALLTDQPMFDAFYPSDFESLASAKKSGRVNDDTALLVLQRQGTTLTLLTMQMSYHHIAQGELEGEPWMVSF